MARVTCDENGLVRGFSYHDGFLDGVLVGDGGVVYLALRAQSGERRVLTLIGVTALSVDAFRKGNIVLDLRVLPATTAAADAGIAKLLADRLYLAPASLAPNAVVFRLESSIGADVLAVCAEVEISAAGTTLSPIGPTT
jgi:hypothetical protein